jgi:glutamate-1-semialdehyde 2,1-aminomutase
MRIQKCLDMQSRAQQKIPGMSQLLSKRPDMFSSGVWPGYYQDAKGVEVWDIDGNHYIDMSIAGIGANVLGYADPDVNAAVKHAIDRGSSCSLNSPEEVELAELLCELHPWAGKVRYARSGGESMAMAIRIARAYSKKDKVAFCGYHGWHDWYLAANLNQDNALAEHLLPGLDPVGVPKVLQGTAFPFRYNHLQDLIDIVAKHKKDLGVIVMESIRGQKPQKDFLEGVQSLAKEINAVLIVDEISAGFRLTTGGAHLTMPLNPDIAVFSKALGNGFPIAAVIGRDHIMQAAEDSFMSSTNWSERIGPVAALAMIKKHRDYKVADHLCRVGKMVQDGWQIAAQKAGLVITVGGIYPLSHFIFDNKDAPVMKAYFVQAMLEKGFLATNLFYAMYAHQPEHVEKYIQAVTVVFKEIVSFHSAGNLKEQLKGQPARSGFKRLT